MFISPGASCRSALKGRLVLHLFIFFFLTAFVGDAAAQDIANEEALRRAYASVENSIRGEFEVAMEGLARDAAVRSASEIENARDILKFISYNKAAIFAYCVVSTQREAASVSSRQRSASNVILTTCVENQFGELRRFTGLRAYVGTFFPERVLACERRARLPEREQVLRPYAFLNLDQPRLYDFAEYNRCLSGGMSRYLGATVHLSSAAFPARGPARSDAPQM